MQLSLPWLLNKVQNPTKMGEFRPISCCNTIYKCITKIIANRLKACLPNLISPNQTAFVQSTRIAENILLVQELVKIYLLFILSKMLYQGWFDEGIWLSSLVFHIAYSWSYWGPWNFQKMDWSVYHYKIYYCLKWNLGGVHSWRQRSKTRGPIILMPFCQRHGSVYHFFSLDHGSVY